MKRFLFFSLALFVSCTLLLGCRDRSNLLTTLSIAKGSARGRVHFHCDPESGVSCGPSIRAMWLDDQGGRAGPPVMAA
jgi:hypothetical protein